MANATVRVPVGTVPWGDDKIKRPLAAAAAIYYPGAMVALDASGNAVKCDDTAGIRFDGINAESVRVQVFSGDSAGDRSLTVERPWRFVMAIDSAAAGDEGTAVYAAYDNQVSKSTSHSVQVGWIDQVISSTLVLVTPMYTPLSPVEVSSNTLAFGGSTGANSITMPDNLADALSFKEGSNSYLTFTTTDSAERVLLKKQTRLIDSAKLAFGDGDDITVAWDGTDLDVLQATANSSIKWGVDGAGIDHVWYGDTASTSMTWDQSADTLLFTGACRVQFTGTTGQPELHLTDNLADALSVKIPSGNDLMIFTTTDSGEKVTIPAGLVQGSDATDRVLIKGIYRNPSVVAVAVPTIADAETDVVAVDVSGAFSMQPAVGDAVIAIPAEALPTDCLLAGAYVTATDTISVTFTTKEGGSGVTGANKNFYFLVIDLT